MPLPATPASYATPQTAPGGVGQRRPSAGSRGRAGQGLPLPTRDRHPGYLIGALALVLGLATLAMGLYARAGAKSPVLVMVREVPAGHVIERQDVSTVEVAGAVTAIGADHLDSVVGQPAAVRLLPHMLMQRSMIGDDDGLAPTEAHVGVAVASGRAPADGVAAGDTVIVMRVPPPGAALTSFPGAIVAPSDSQGSADSKDDDAQRTRARTDPSSPSGEVGVSEALALVGRAHVFSVRPDPGDAAGTLVTVVVPREDAAAVAAASAAGQVALVKVAAS